MIGIKSFRWSTTGISNGRLRLTNQLQLSRKLSSSATYPVKPPQTSCCVPQLQRRVPWSSFSRRQTAAFSSSSRFQNATAAPSSAPSTPLSAPATTPPSAPSSSSSALSPDVDNLTSVEYETSIYDIPEHIGYLKELGLDYGWGPTAMVEWCLEHIHIWGGLPWWASICTLAFLFRCLSFPLAVSAGDQAVRMQRMTPLMDPLRLKMLEATRSNDRTTMVKTRQQLRTLRRQHNISGWKTFMPLSVIIPTGFAQFRLGRGMADLPVPALESESFLWIPDLTMSDPYYILPLVTGAVVHLTMKRGGEMGGPAGFGETLKFFISYVLPCTSAAIMCVWPATLQIYFVLTSTLGYVQSKIFQSPSCRRWLGMLPLPDKPKPAGGNGSGNSESGSIFTKFVSDTKNATSKEAASTTTSLSHGVNRILTPEEIAAKKAAERQSFIDKGLDRMKGKFNSMGDEIRTKAVEHGYDQLAAGANKGVKNARRSTQETRNAQQYEEIKRKEAAMERDTRRKKGRKQA